MKRWACAAALALLLAPAAGAADTTAPLDPDSRGRTVEEPFAPVSGARLTEKAVVARFLKDPKVAAWLDRYPPNPPTEATFDIGDPALDGEDLVGQGRADRPRQGRGRRRRA